MRPAVVGTVAGTGCKIGGEITCGSIGGGNEGLNTATGTGTGTGAARICEGRTDGSVLVTIGVDVWGSGQF